MSCPPSSTSPPLSIEREEDPLEELIVLVSNVVAERLFAVSALAVVVARVVFPLTVRAEEEAFARVV